MDYDTLYKHLNHELTINANDNQHSMISLYCKSCRCNVHGEMNLHGSKLQQKAMFLKEITNLYEDYVLADFLGCDTSTVSSMHEPELLDRLSAVYDSKTPGYIAEFIKKYDMRP